MSIETNGWYSTITLPERNETSVLTLMVYSIVDAFRSIGRPGINVDWDMAPAPGHFNIFLDGSLIESISVIQDGISGNWTVNSHREGFKRIGEIKVDTAVGTIAVADFAVVSHINSILDSVKR